MKAKGLSFNEKAVNLCISGPRIETERRSTVTRFDPVREEQVSCKSLDPPQGFLQSGDLHNYSEWKVSAEKKSS